MTTFEDGPAKGRTLMLRRAPRFLRVAQADGKFDALDQLDDTPEPGETLHAYEITAPAGICHVLRRPHGSGWFAIAEYRLVPDQPSEADLRDNDRWREWCTARAHAAVNHQPSTINPSP